YLTAFNNVTGSSPILQGIGSDTNVILSLRGQGTGGVQVQGTGTNNSAPAGYVGEFISSVIASGSPVTMTNATATNVTSISLTAGDWDVWGNMSWVSTGTGPSAIACWVSSTSATVPDLSLYTGLFFAATTVISAATGVNAAKLRFSLSSTTTIYLTGYTANVSGTSTVCGGIYARRRR
ncbi:MAG TPA: hypothetical protein VNX68_19370, partial [Nitrosopumilaceae archaeon]|nr:hypothetical protein [Nitrosopumilaceae archaeon]